MKRLFDFVAALIGLALVWPVLLLAAPAILWDSPGPVFYGGIRIGRGGKPFRQWKLRTMVHDADRRGSSRTPNRDPRVTRVGHFLRKFKIDEFPQFFNVLVGDMSIVGPRPDVQEYVDLYKEHERVLLTLRPGITDWASLWDVDEGGILDQHADPDSAYRELIHPTKVKLQMGYYEHHSLWIDTLIIFLTLVRILRKRSAVHTKYIDRLLLHEAKQRAVSENSTGATVP